MAKEVHKTGKRNFNGYPVRRKSKEARWTLILLALVVIFCYAFECYDKSHNGSWRNNYTDTGIIKDAPLASNSELSVYYLNVGQSDCSIIMNNGQVLMVDTGIQPEFKGIREVMQSLGISKIDYLLITHQHDDHMGNAVDIMKLYDVQNIIMPKLSSINMPTTFAYEDLLNTIKSQQINAIAATPGLSFKVGDATCEILAPLAQDENLNNMSAVTKVTFGNNSFLFEGDAEKKVESALLKNGTDVSADVIKVGHHGSKTSSSQNYLLAVSPKIAVISCAEKNSYGHPHKVTIDTLQTVNADIYITYNTGLLLLKSDGNKITATTENGDVKTYE